MSSTLHPILYRDPDTRRYDLILPTTIADDAVRACSLSTVIRDFPADDVTARRLQLEVRRADEAFEVRILLAPYLAAPAIRRLTPPNVERFWQHQGTLRHLLNPMHLDNIVDALRRTLRPGAPRLARSRDRDPPYLPNGPWEYLASQDPRDMAIRSRLTLRASDVTLATVPDVIRRLLRRSRYLTRYNPTLRIEYGDNPYSQFSHLNET
jgi:hypothetical protein